MAAPKKRYEKPKLKKGFFRLRNLSENVEARTPTLLLRRGLLCGKKHFVRIHASETPRSIMEELRAAGLNVEEAGNATKRHITISKYAGKPLMNCVLWGDVEKLESLLPKAFELLGKVHARNILHSHPHPANLVVKKGEVCLVDFKLARRVSPDWTSADNIVKTFKDDRYYLFNRFVINFGIRAITHTGHWNLGRVWPQWKRVMRGCFERMVAQYPCKEEVKREVLADILASYGLSG